MAFTTNSISDTLRTWRRALKAVLPYVRRREHRVLQRNHASLIEALDGLATPATAAHIKTVKPLAQGLTGEVCLFVSYAFLSELKQHVVEHIWYLLSAGVQVLLIINTDLPTDEVSIDSRLLNRLSGVLIRENLGFDFGAWAHVWSLCEGTERWARLYLINDSIVGPLNLDDFTRMMERLRRSDADVIGLTESLAPQRHLQSYFLVFNSTALHDDALKSLFGRVLNWPSKSQVIEIYESRLTALLEAHGLRCTVLFPALSRDPLSSDDTSIRWAELVQAGFPYLKTRVIARHSQDVRIKAWLAARKDDRLPT